jgi:aminoglycoside phosphotransferase (APT) family kinase protein
MLGLPEVRLVRSHGGASRAGFTAEDLGGRPVAFLLVDDGESGLRGTEFDVHREASLLERVYSFGVPVPRVLGQLDVPAATVLEFMPGSSVVPPEHLASVTSSFGRLLAEVHEVPVSVLDAKPPPTATAAIESDLQWWESFATDAGMADEPVVRAAVAVLRSLMPCVETAPCLVHGDAGIGNFLVDGDRITALLDWEMAHVGERHEDIAWMSIRAVHTDFGSIEAAIEAYESASGHAVDRSLLQWHVGFVLMKTVVALSAALRQGGGGRLVLLQYNLFLAYRALLCSTLGGLLGERFVLLGKAPHVQRSERSRLVERLLDLLAPEQREARRIAKLLLALPPAAQPADREVGDIRATVRMLCASADSELQASDRAVALVRRAQAIGIGR